MSHIIILLVFLLFSEFRETHLYDQFLASIQTVLGEKQHNDTQHLAGEATGEPTTAGHTVNFPESKPLRETTAINNFR